LEITFHGKIATIDSADCIQGYCTSPIEKIVLYTEYQPSEVVVEINQLIENVAEILNSLSLNIDALYMETSAQLQPKRKSCKLLSIIKDIQATTLQTGN